MYSQIRYPKGDRQSLQEENFKWQPIQTLKRPIWGKQSIKKKKILKRSFMGGDLIGHPVRRENIFLNWWIPQNKEIYQKFLPIFYKSKFPLSCVDLVLRKKSQTSVNANWNSVRNVSYEKNTTNNKENHSQIYCYWESSEITKFSIFREMIKNILHSHAKGRSPKKER